MPARGILLSDQADTFIAADSMGTLLIAHGSKRRC